MTWQVVPQPDGSALFSLSARDYEALSRNMGEITRWVREAAYQIHFYRNQRKTTGVHDGEP